MNTIRQQGFSAVEAIVILGVIVVLAGAGYGYMKMHNNHGTPASSTNTSAVSVQVSPVTVPVAPQVNSNSDLNTALNTLNQTNLDAGSSDSSQLNSQSGNF
jgi:flagellar basal body-associated protein FliL